jgi:hypothetical protein
MRSILQNEASRRNGAQSRGPRSATGRANSSRNRYTHGLLSKTIVIEGEEPSRFAALLNSLRADLQPVNALEESLIEDLATYRWRQRRFLAMETACLSARIRRQTQTGADSAAIRCSVARAARAFDTLSRDSCALELINRHEFRAASQFNRTLRRLLSLRAAEKHKNDASNLGSD